MVNLETDNGDILNEQNDILAEAHKFYKDLYACKDNNLTDKHCLFLKRK